MIQDNVEHGSVHRDIREHPQCVCQVPPAKDTMWDRWYCSISNVWLEGTWGACWCKDCINKPVLTFEQECVLDPINKW